MGLFKRKQDPISERAKDLSRQIKQLEAKIQSLESGSDPESEPTPSPNSNLSRGKTAPSSASSGPGVATGSTSTPPNPGQELNRRDPVFESVSQNRLKDLEAPPAHFNDLGVRKYDLPAAWRRLMNNVRGPASTNPKLVDLLAAGSLQGMRPLRSEKRIARNRFLIFVLGLILLLWGLFAVLVRG